MPPLTPGEVAALEAHIGKKVAKTTRHGSHLDADVGAHRGGVAHAPHAASRHGYQTGWQSQLIRCCTQFAPDQAASPDGIRPSVTEWNRETGTWASLRKFMTDYSPVKLPYIDPPTVQTYGADGAPVTRTITEHETTPIAMPADATVAGLGAGGFISPEAQQAALDSANSYAHRLWSWTEAEFATGGGVWRPFSRIGCVFGNYKGGYGLGFQPGHGYMGGWARSGVERAIEAYENRWTVQQWEVELDPSQAHLAAKIKFPTMDDLCTYLGVQAVWQKHALVILDRAAAHGKWTLVTAYPVNLATGWAPSGPAGGARHKSTGPIWTGRVRKTVAGAAIIGNYPVPVR